MVCNALMWTTFTKALQGASSTVEITVTNSSANLFFTVSTLEPKEQLQKSHVYSSPPQAVLGNAVFGETLSLQWWLGASIIVTGLIIIHSTAQQADGHKAE